MKQVSVFFISWFLSAFSYKAMAQNEARQKEKEKKKSEEIVIRKSGDKDANITIQISGDKVLINGKPLTEFKSDDISVSKRKVMVCDDCEYFAMADGMAMQERMGNFESENFGWNSEGGSKVVLGVTTEKSDEGAVILEVTKGSGAEKAGLLKGDVILKFGETKIDDSQDLYDAVNKKKVNDAVKIEYKRDGSTKIANAVIQERKEKTYAIATPNGTYKSYTQPKTRATPRVNVVPNVDEHIENAMDFAYAFGRPKLGLKIQDTEEENGVKVLSIEENSTSAKAGLKAEDIIVEIGGQAVKTTDDAREALADNSEKSAYKIKAKRAGKEMIFDIKIPKKLKTANL